MSAPARRPRRHAAIRAKRIVYLPPSIRVDRIITYNDGTVDLVGPTGVLSITRHSHKHSSARHEDHRKLATLGADGGEPHEITVDGIVRDGSTAF